MKGVSRTLSNLKRVVGPASHKLLQRRVQHPSSHWELSRDAAGELMLSGVRLSDLAERYGSPLFVVDARKLDANVASFTTRPTGLLGGVECFYSYKTNPVPAVLARMHQHGVGAEVISEYELWLARKLGLPGERIVMNGPGRSAAALREGIELGALIVANHAEEIPLLCELSRAAGRRARVGLRVVPANGSGNQFGEPIDATALETFQDMLARPELEVVAVHGHLGAELSTGAVLTDYVLQLLAFCDQLRTRFGFWPQILDVGGSLGCPTTTKLSARAMRLNSALGLDLELRDPSSVLGIEEYVQTLVSLVETHCSRVKAQRPRIFVEPGRGMTSNTHMLLCQVMTTKHSGTPGLDYVVLDAGINVAEPLRSEHHEMFVLRGSDSAKKLYRLVGPICTLMDTLAWSRRLPELQVGSRLAIMDAGAYFIPFSTSFSFPQPPIVMVDQGEQTLLRRRETFDDVVRRDSF